VAFKIAACSSVTIDSRHKQDYSSIPGLEEIKDDEFAKYTNVIGPDRGCSDANPLEVLTFWKRAAQIACHYCQHAWSRDIYLHMYFVSM
jgi:hypothetical protein